MSETEKMQIFHQRAIKGENLTMKEQAALQNWYNTLDREEDSLLNSSQPISNAADLCQYLADTTKQVSKISREIENLVEQNANLRNENQSLRKSLESRLSEKVT